MNQSPLSNLLHSALNKPAHKVVTILRGKQVLMPSATYELTRDTAGTLGVDHDKFMAMLWEQMNVHLLSAMDAVIQNRECARRCTEAEARYTREMEVSHHAYDNARALVDALVGTEQVVVL